VGAQGTIGTVPIVSAHFRSQYSARLICKLNRDSSSVLSSFHSFPLHSIVLQPTHQRPLAITVTRRSLGRCPWSRDLTLVGAHAVTIIHRAMKTNRSCRAIINQDVRRRLAHCARAGTRPDSFTLHSFISPQNVIAKKNRIETGLN